MPPIDPYKRSAFYLHRLEATASQSADELTALFASCDSTLAASRRTIREAEQQHQQPTEHLWQRVRQRATHMASSERSTDSCCICCEGLYGGGRLVLLSCSHVLHGACLRSYEQYTSGEVVVGSSSSSGSGGGEGEGGSGSADGGIAGGVDVLFVPAGCVCPMCRSVYSKIAFTPPAT